MKISIVCHVLIIKTTFRKTNNVLDFHGDRIISLCNLALLVSIYITHNHMCSKKSNEDIANLLETRRCQSIVEQLAHVVATVVLQ